MGLETRAGLVAENKLGLWCSSSPTHPGSPSPGSQETEQHPGESGSIAIYGASVVRVECAVEAAGCPVTDCSHVCPVQAVVVSGEGLATVMGIGWDLRQLTSTASCLSLSSRSWLVAAGISLGWEGV